MTINLGYNVTKSRCKSLFNLPHNRSEEFSSKPNLEENFVK